MVEKNGYKLCTENSKSNAKIRNKLNILSSNKSYILISIYSETVVKLFLKLYMSVKITWAILVPSSEKGCKRFK